MFQFNKSFYINCLIAITILILSFFSISIDGPDGRLKFEKKGTLAKPNEFPHHVSILFRGLHHCSGTLISNKHVLTPASCVISFLDRNESISLIKVAVGIIKLSNNITHDIDKITPHQFYKRYTASANVAVIRLKKEISLSESVGVISLPKVSNELYIGQELMVSDFGKKPIFLKHQNSLKKFTVYLVDCNAECQKFYADHMDFHGKLFALESDEPGPCLLDRGSPVIINKKYLIGTKIYLIGMFLGVGKYGCGPGIPYWFTDVKNYLDFIESEIAETN